MNDDRDVESSSKGPGRLRKVTVVALVMFCLEPLLVFLFPSAAPLFPPVFAQLVVLGILVVASFLWGRRTVWRKRVTTAAIVAGLIVAFWVWTFVGVAQKRPFDMCQGAARLVLPSEHEFGWPDDWDAEPHVVFSWPGNYTCQFSGEYSDTSFTLPIPTMITAIRGYWP